MARFAPLCLRCVAVGVGERGGVGGWDADGLHRRRGVAGRLIGAEDSVDSSYDYCRRRSFCRRDSRRGAAVAAAPTAGRSEPRDRRHMTYFFSTSAESSMTFPPRNTLTINLPPGRRAL